MTCFLLELLGDATHEPSAGQIIVKFRKCRLGVSRSLLICPIKIEKKISKLPVFSCEKSYLFVANIECAIFSCEKKAGGNNESKLKAIEL